MAKYEMLIAASGKRGSALLPCVVVDEKGIKRAAVRAKAMARASYPEYEKFNVVKMKVISDERKGIDGTVERSDKSGAGAVRG